MTWATDQQAVEPWVVGNDPTTGEGYESAVAAAVTERLGFAADRTTWVRGTFDSIISPGPKDFDIALDQIPITPERGTAVDLSSSYYDVRQAVVAVDGNPATKTVDDVADLKPAKFGARTRTAALEAINAVIEPEAAPVAFESSNDAKAALVDGKIDVLVVDLPTAYYLTTVELRNSKIVGTLPQTSDKPEQFGLVLELESPLTSCVTQAVNALRQDGTLSTLEARWLSNTSAPPLS